MTTAVPLDSWLRPTRFLDHGSAEVQSFVKRALDGAGDTARDRARALYYAVRDGVFYEVYGTDMSPAGLRASAVVRTGRGFCVQKSILYAAAARAAGIPSKLVVTEVRNHLASDRLRQMVGGEVFVHLLNGVHVDGRWIRVTPVFNAMLCRLYGMAPLEFDGSRDSELQPYDRSGDRTMEFLREYGEFDDLPYEWLSALMRSRHPGMFDGARTAGGGSLLEENCGEGDPR
jgi:transglutaminase-like putative cysteine protease